MGKLIIIQKQNRLFSFLFENNKPQLIETAALPSAEGLLGNIYIAKVKDIVKGIQSAFLSISNERTVYLSLANLKEVLCANRTISEQEPIRAGDELIIQITGEALKTKPPTASGDLTLTGQYVVCRYFGHGIKYSKKLTASQKDYLEQQIKNAAVSGRKKYQFTIRTNAGELTDLKPLIDEINTFIHTFDTITDIYAHRTCYSMLYQSPSELIQSVQNISVSDYDEIVTDQADVYEILTQNFPRATIRFYQDELLSLSKLYSIDTHLKEVLSSKVWLACGGYLIIEPTEAMVVIDVNSGKAETSKKNSKGYIQKVNLEAAKEVARQLRLRNYSGIIMVDFINMSEEEDRHNLLCTLDDYLQKDKIRTRVIDITALGIVEITRKKVAKPISAFFTDKNLQSNT